MNLEESERIAKEEFARYGFPEPFDKKEITTNDYISIKISVKFIIADRIEKAIKKIARNAYEHIKKSKQTVTINENVWIEPTWFNKLTILEDEFRINVELDNQNSETEKYWGFIKVKVNDQKIFYTQDHDRANHTFLYDSKNAKKAFQIILREAEKIK